MMIAIEEAKTGRSMKNLTIQTPRGAGASATPAIAGPGGTEPINAAISWDIGETKSPR
jgi:hypothetical protein